MRGGRAGPPFTLRFGVRAWRQLLPSFMRDASRKPSFLPLFSACRNLCAVNLGDGFRRSLFGCFGRDGAATCERTSDFMPTAYVRKVTEPTSVTTDPAKRASTLPPYLRKRPIYRAFSRLQSAGGHGLVTACGRCTVASAERAVRRDRQLYSR